MIINHNMASLNTLNSLNSNNTTMQKSLAKLSSGLRINTAADDAAGLAISEKMRGQISGLDQASANADDAISLLQTAEGALDETTSILQRMRELAVEAASDTLTDSDRTDIQSEFSELTAEIDRIATTTQFNTKNLLDGSMSAASGACANVSTNTSLLANTLGTCLVTALSDTSGNSLGIACGDTVTLSYVVDGAMITCTATVAAGMDMDTFMACFDSLACTAASGGGATIAYCATSITMTATCVGSTSAIYGVTFTVADSDGAENATAGNALSGFSQTSAATNNQCNGSATVLIGANTGQTLNLSIGNMSASSLGVANLSVESQSSADVAIKVIDAATATVSAARGKMGAEENRLEHTINNLTTSSENITAAESRIRDVDMAAEMATYTKLSVINQAATAMLAQANSQPEQVLTLLK